MPRDVGTLPVFYGHKESARAVLYTDAEWSPCYVFGYGLSYTAFATENFTASSSSSLGGASSFTDGDTIFFDVDVANTGAREGSHVLQVYLLGRTSSVTQPVKQLMAFRRVYLAAGARAGVRMELEVDRYLPVLDRGWEWVLERGEYVFALLEDSGADADVSAKGTMRCV